MNVKTLLIGIGVSCLFFLASCRAVFQTPPLAQKEKDKIIQPTKAIVPNETHPEVAKGTSFQTGEATKVEASLTTDTPAKIVTVAESPLLPIEDKKVEEVVLPKGTEVLLPPQTDLTLTAPSTMVLSPGSEITLPIGTEISITRVNWYAILFYCLLVGCLFWYYVQGRRLPEDQNSDGYVDDDKVVGKKRIEQPKKSRVKKR